MSQLEQKNQYARDTTRYQYRMASLPISFGSLLLSVILILGFLAKAISANDSGLECPASMPEDLSPCTFDSTIDPNISCDYESEDCCPSGGCAQVRCQCILSVFACIVEPLPCPELCPETKPNSTVSCNFGVGLDCFYGDPIFCALQVPFFYPAESVCYCFNNTFSCKEFACKTNTPTAAPVGFAECPTSDPWRNVSAACALDEGTTCNYGEFCCTANGDCVPDTLCTCQNNMFVCEQPSLPCPTGCPQNEPVSDVCELNPRLVCEYDFGKCEGGDTANAARGCVCNFLDDTFICFDTCNSTVIDPSTPSSSPSMPNSLPPPQPSNASGMPLQSPSQVSLVPSQRPSDIPSNVPSDMPSNTQPQATPVPSPTASSGLVPENFVDCPDEEYISVSCSFDSNITCRYSRFRCTADLISPAACTCDTNVFVCTFDDERCNNSPVSALPSTVPPVERIPIPSSAPFLKAVNNVACLVLVPLLIVYR